MKQVMRVAAVGAWAAFILICVAMAVGLYWSWILDRNQYWSDDPDKIINLFDLERPFDCRWCQLEPEKTAYLLHRDFIREDARVCLFGGPPITDARRSAELAHAMVLGYENRINDRERRSISAGGDQSGFVLLRPNTRRSQIALIHVVHIDLVLPQPHETTCYAPDRVALVSNPAPARRFSLITRDTPE